MTQTTPAAGWYPDSQGQNRYWDGLAWTEHVWTAEGATADATGDFAPANTNGSATANGAGPYGAPAADQNPAVPTGNTGRVLAAAVSMIFGVIYALLGALLTATAAGALAAASALGSRRSGPFGVSAEMSDVGGKIVILSLLSLGLALLLFSGATLCILHRGSAAAVAGLAISALVMLIVSIKVHPILLILLFLALLGLAGAIAALRGRTHHPQT